MPKIDDSIRRIDNVICRHLDSIENSTRGAISQDILEQLTKLVKFIMLKFYSDGKEIEQNKENLQKAIDFAQVNNELNTLYKFNNYLQVVTEEYTLDEDGSERLMLKYYKYLLETRNLLRKYYGLRILHNLSKFPLKVDTTLQEYYTRISEKIEQYPVQHNAVESTRYYIQKIKPIFIGMRNYSEITFSIVDNKKIQSKSNRVIAFTKLPIETLYASKFHLVHETIEVLGKTMPIIIIDSWEISIRDCEFKNFTSLIKEKGVKVPFPEQKLLCGFLTKNYKYSLCDIMDFPDADYNKLTTYWRSQLKTSVFIDILDYCRNIIQADCAGQNLLRYLLYIMNNNIIKNQRYPLPNRNISNLYIQNGSIQFDSLPFIRSPLGHNPKTSVLFNCIPAHNRKHELFARFIHNNTESLGQLFTDASKITRYKDIPALVDKYNDCVWFGHKPRSELVYENGYIFINEYKMDTCEVIETLQELSQTGIDNYYEDISTWLLFTEHQIDCEEKKAILRQLYEHSKVAVIYGSAGVGKSTLINHVAHYLNDRPKLYLTQTNPAKENLTRRITSENNTFSTIASYLNREDYGFSIEYELLVIDECSTVSNNDMVKILKKAKFKRLLLVGDTYQIDSIKFGNWFSVLKSFLPETSVFELLHPYRTKDKNLLELWDKVRHMEDDTKEVIERESYSLKADLSLLSNIEKNEAVLCLNYDGLYGINNINRLLQEDNPHPAYYWDIHQYKVGDPILFLDTNRFYPVIYNNMKGVIKGIEILDAGTNDERIQFDIELPKKLSESDCIGCDFQLLDDESSDVSVIRFFVNKIKSTDDDDDDTDSTQVPFQVAYAVSIHKAQGLEYESVRIVVTEEVEELVTHSIFYTAITRAQKKLKIYWTPEVEEKVIARIKPRDVRNDVEILRSYINIQ